MKLHKAQPWPLLWSLLESLFVRTRRYTQRRCQVGLSMPPYSSSKAHPQVSFHESMPPQTVSSFAIGAYSDFSILGLFKTLRMRKHLMRLHRWGTSTMKTREESSQSKWRKPFAPASSTTWRTSSPQSSSSPPQWIARLAAKDVSSKSSAQQPALALSSASTLWTLFTIMA